MILTAVVVCIIVALLYNYVLDKMYD